ncbi:glycosyltransferase family 2 protein [Rhodosalinus sp. K401]|uniref:glycosyltransferase family 2 protein n=1 Tax=Rhodosalinus sp. K401 TaxID=3239195 RepID=UPI003524CBD3
MQDRTNVNATRLAREAEGVEQPELSILIVNYNCAQDTIRAVQSVQANADDFRVEIIVVDNASTDDSVDRIRAAVPDARVVATGANGGYAWGNNVGISIAQGRYVLVLNPDTEVSTDALQKAVAYLDEHQHVGLLGARSEDGDGHVEQTCFRYPRLRDLFWRAFLPFSVLRRSRLFGDRRYRSLSLEDICDVEAVVGCFMMVPRRVIDEVGGLDDRFFMYSEETEWCWRIRKAGYQVHYHPDVRIIHYGGGSTGGVSPWSAVETAKSQILFLRLTRGAGVARVGTGLILLGDALRAAWFVPISVTRAGRARGAHWRARFVFLCKALIDQPKGQTPPPIPDTVAKAGFTETDSNA